MQEKCHVLYIITKLELGGAQKVCLSLFNAFNNEQNTAWLLSGTQGILASTSAPLPNAFLIESLKREICWSDVKAWWQIYKKIRALKKDYPDLIVHTHSTKAGYLGRTAAWMVGVKQIVHTVHGFGFHEYQSKIQYAIAYILEKFISRITTTYVCVSEADVTIGIQYIKNFAKKYVLIRAAIEDKKFIPALNKPISFSTCIYGTIACFKPQKNIFDLLEAFRQVYMHHTKNVYLEIIGDGLQRPLIEAWIQEHNLTQQITLHGWQEQPEKIMQKWDCFVLSSLWEGLPCAIIEARALQIPIIAYNVGGISDVVKHGKNGFLCAAKCVNLLAHYMALVGQNNYLRINMGTYKEDLSEFTQIHMIDAHRNLYKQ